MNKTLKVAAIKLKNYVGDPEKSLAAAEVLVWKAAEQGAQLIALPELSTCG